MRNRIFTAILIVDVILVFTLFAARTYVPPILMYHSIDEKEQETKLSLCPAGFAKQMKFLHDHNYNVIPLEEMVFLIASKAKIPLKTVTITFDDGFKNNITCALPVLKEYGFPATIFVITSKLGMEGYLSWEDLKELEANGVTIGSHTKSHLLLPYLDYYKMWDEIYGSKKVLEHGLGHKVEFLCYPCGAYNDRVKAMARNAGYAAACATNPGKHASYRDLYALKRVRISRTSNNLAVFCLESSGYYTLIKELRDEE